MNTFEIKIFPDIEAIAGKISEDLRDISGKCQKQSGHCNIVLPGGNTPKKIYQILAKESVRNKIPWSMIQLFWGDERCVAPDHPASNYGMAYHHLIKHIPIPEENIHRIFGENSPAIEIRRYAAEIKKNITGWIKNIPRFDWILLGLGVDGHTASLFPDDKIVEEASGLCAYTLGPANNYQRITLTYNSINQAERVTFLVSGSAKADILIKVLEQNGTKSTCPAARIKPKQGKLQWYIDASAAVKLNNISSD